MIVLFLAPGFEETEAIAPLDIARRAGCEIKTVGIGSKTVTGSHVGYRPRETLADIYGEYPVAAEGNAKGADFDTWTNVAIADGAAVE